MDIQAELKMFDEKLAREKAQLLARQERRRADFARQLAARSGAGASAEAADEGFTHRAMIPRSVSPSIGCKTAGTGAAGREDKCSGCSKQSSCGTAKRQEDTAAAEIAQRMSEIKHKVLVMSTKGGVGKSMVSAQLAYALAKRGFKVGLMDVDICGATVPKMTGKRGEGAFQTPQGLRPIDVCENLVAMSLGFLVDDEREAVIWRGPRKHGLIQMFLRDVAWGALDFLVVDTPPGTSDEHLGTVQLLKATGIDGAVLVTTPQDVSVIEVGKQVDFCRRVNIPVLGVVENFADLVCPLCQGVTCVWPRTSGGGKHLAKSHAVPFLGSVPLDPAVARNGETGRPVDEAAPAGRVLYVVADTVAAAVGAVSPSDSAL